MYPAMKRLVLPILMALVAVSCNSSADVTTSQSLPPSTVETSTTLDATTSSVGSTTTSDDNPAVLPDGDRQFAFVTGVEQADDGTWTVTADYAQWLTGDDAIEAAEQAGDLDDNGDLPSGDYYILNENPRLRELVLDPAAPIALNACFISGDCVVLVDATIADWVALLNGEVPESLGEGFQWYGNGLLPYWLIFDGETIVGIEEQYLP